MIRRLLLITLMVCLLAGACRLSAQRTCRLFPGGPGRRTGAIQLDGPAAVLFGFTGLHDSTGPGRLRYEPEQDTMGQRAGRTEPDSKRHRQQRNGVYR